MKQVTSILIFLVILSYTTINSVQSLNSSNNKPPKCGFRSYDAPLNNASQNLNFNVDHFRTAPETFPWIVKLVLTNPEGRRGPVHETSNPHLLLCTGAVISEFVALFPAHCISGNDEKRLEVVHPGLWSGDRIFSVETIILHPDFVFKHPSHEHDLAVVKIQVDKVGNGFDTERQACLPEFDEDPVDRCQVANYFPDSESPSKVSTLISHKILVLDIFF